MATATSQALTRSSSALRMRKTVLYTNGAFLTLMGGPFAIFDLLSFWWGAGPLGEMYHNELLTVGLFEAHGLALMMGLILLRAARFDPRPAWHLLGAGIHLLLGSSNLIFWALFSVWDVVTAEIVVTCIHWLFMAAHLICLWKARAD